MELHESQHLSKNIGAFISNITNLTVSIEQLNGSQATNRAPQGSCQIAAHNDYQAMQCWLNEYKHKLTTYRTYRKEAERLLLWCVIQHKKPFSSLARDDFEAYFQFLTDPQPRALWCQPKRKKTHDKSWKPFQGPLSLQARSQAMSIIQSLMSYLVDARYLTFNPLVLIRRRSLLKHQNDYQTIKRLERQLEIDEWYALLDSVDEMPETTIIECNEKARTRFLIAIFYLLGIRGDELQNHTWNAFRKIGQEWWFVVMGKGDKPGMVPVNDELLDHIIRYRSHINLPPVPTPEDHNPIITSWTSNQALSLRQMNRLIKKVALHAAQKFSDQPAKAKRLKHVSAHWLRHLSATMQDHIGIHERIIQENHRHSNIETTRGYIHLQQKQRHQAMQKLRLRLDEKLSETV